jgi:hypothetical protein
MSSMLIIKILLPILLCLLAGFFFFVALKTLLGRRPLIFSAKWLFAFVCLAFLPSITAFLVPVFLGSGKVGVVHILNPLIYFTLLVFFWIQMKGYLVFAISDSYFRDALLASAKSLDFTIEETISQLQIKESGEALQVSVQGWIGTAQIKGAAKTSKETVRQVAAGMDVYFATHPGRMNFLTSYLYLIMGLFMLALAGFLIYLLSA